MINRRSQLSNRGPAALSWRAGASTGPSPVASAEADRALRVQAGSLAAATGRSRRDVLRSLMTGIVEGAPEAFARNTSDAFRAELHGATHLALALTPYERQSRLVEQLRNLGGEVIA